MNHHNEFKGEPMAITVFYQRPFWVVKTPFGLGHFETEEQALKYARGLLGSL